MAGLLKGSDQQKAARIIQECEAAIRASREDLNRGYEIWQAYFAASGRQWPESKRQYLREQDRHAWQFDVLSPKVDTLAGSLVAELPDIDWAPVSGARNTATEAIRDTYAIDKELFNYNNVLLEVIRDGCVHSGWLQITESKKYNPARNISIERVRPGYFIPDPYWRTDNDRDLESAWKIAYMTAEQIKQKWPKVSAAVNLAIEKKRQSGKTTPTDGSNRDALQNQYVAEIDDEYRVIEYHWVEAIKRDRLVGAKFNADTETIKYMPFPLVDDEDTLKRFAEINEIDWDTVEVTEYEDRVHHVTTVSDIDNTVLLEDGASRLQVNGLPFYHFTSMRYNGHDKGVAESILDAQRMINEKESYLLEMVAKASGGSELWNKDLWQNETDRQRFVKKANKPGHKEFVDLDGVKNIKEDVGPAAPNQIVFNELDRMYNQVIPMVSRVSDAMSAVSDTGDSGILFERKYQINRIANVLLDKGVQQLMNNLGEGYFYQWKITYAKVERDITSKDGQKSVVLNKHTVVNGEPVIINSVAETPRTRVVVTESRNTPIYQMRKKTEMVEMIKSIPEGDQLRLQFALREYFDAMNLPDKQQGMLEMINDMEMQKAFIGYMRDMSTMDAEIKNNGVLAAQAEQFLKKLGQMQGQPPAIQQQITPEADAAQEVPIEQLEQNVSPVPAFAGQEEI